MNQFSLIWLSEWLIICAAAMAALVTVTSSLYEIRTMAWQRRLRLANNSNQPHLTVLVYANYNVSTLESCLDSIRQSSYRNYDVVVVDNSSNDGTRQLVNDYRQDYPIFPLYFLAKRKPGHRHQALRQAYAKSHRGEFVMVLSATSTLLTASISQSVTGLVAEPKVGALRLNEYYPPFDGLASLSRRLWQLSCHLIFKSVSLVGLMSVSAGQLNTVYRRLAFETKNTKRRISCRYAATIRLVSLDSNWTVPWPLLAPMVAFTTYCVYLAISMLNSSLLLFSWLVMVGWLLVAVWSDEADRVNEKASLSFCIPAVYFLGYLEIISRIASRIGKLVTKTVSLRVKSDRKFNRLAEPKL